MTATTASNGPRTQTPTDPAADRTTGASGPEVMAEALPFETIPAEVLRGHFTRWLTDSLARIARRPAPVTEAEHAPESDRTEAVAAESRPAKRETAFDQTNAIAEPVIEPRAPAEILASDPRAETASASREPRQSAETRSGPTAPETQAKPPTKPKRSKAKNRPPNRKREGPLADAMEPPQAPDAAGAVAKPPPSPGPDPKSEPKAPRRRHSTASATQVARLDADADVGGSSRNAADAGADVGSSLRLDADADAGGSSRIADESDPTELPSPPPRPQYVRIGDRSVWLTKPMLRSRGWTEAAIRDFLPGPEALKPNPRFAISGAPMPVWKPGTVAKAEADPEWRDWLDRSLQRRQTTLEALAGTDDQEFRNRLELADQAIRDCSEPPTLLDSLEPERPLATAEK
ncbi:hypothetical protein GCM10009853_024410 [Glycomyces scopariae]